MAVIIYPAVFHPGGATRALVAASVVDEPAARRPLTLPPVRRSGDDADALRAAVGRSLDDLSTVHRAVEDIDTLGRGLQDKAASLGAASASLSQQMDRLVAETRRMTARLRSSD
jgi:hypothetical protein